MRNKKIFILYFLIILIGAIPIFLVNAQECKPAYANLIIDDSGSMTTDWDSLTRLQGVENAASKFTDLLLQTPDNRESVIAFNEKGLEECDGVWLVHDWSKDADSLKSAINGLPETICGTAYIPALEMAKDKMEEPPADATKVIIFLTDGQPWDDPTTIKNKASDIKKAGTVIFTIAIGYKEQVDEDLLKKMAGTPTNPGPNHLDPDYYFFAPSDADLGKIYEEIYIFLNDMDHDGHVNASCPGGDDSDDNDPCVNPRAPEGYIRDVDEATCNNFTALANLLPKWENPETGEEEQRRATDICGTKYYEAKNEVTGEVRQICSINCNEDRDNDQDKNADESDPDCPKIGGLVPCGRHSDDPTTFISEDAPCTLCHIFVLAKRIVDDIVLPYGSLIAVLIIVIGGVMFITATGDPGRIRTAKNIMKAAGIGLAVILIAWLIVDTIITFLTPASSPFQNWNTIDCPFCGDGNCDPGETSENCPFDCGAPPPPPAACSDTDGGENKLVKGTCTDAGGSYTDTCIDANSIEEYTCNPAGDACISPIDKSCPADHPNCVNGACVAAGPPPAACGNGVLDAGEVCDDGNTIDCDGCKGDCSRLDNICGDNIAECGEACDGTDDAACPGQCQADCKCPAAGCPPCIICP